MALALRLLLVLCLVATMVPAPMAHAGDPAVNATQGGTHDHLRPCHDVDGAASSQADTPPAGHGCCDAGGCDGVGCDCQGCCLHGSALPAAPTAAAASAIPQGPGANADRVAPPPRLAPPVRPPIA